MTTIHSSTIHRRAALSPNFSNPNWALKPIYFPPNFGTEIWNLVNFSIFFFESENLLEIKNM
jgi:hypothetical protein